MKRVLLSHGHTGEAAVRLARLEQAGYRAERLELRGATGIRDLLASPPDAVVIDLSRSHPRAVTSRSS